MLVIRRYIVIPRAASLVFMSCLQFNFCLVFPSFDQLLVVFHKVIGGQVLFDSCIFWRYYEHRPVHSPPVDKLLLWELSSLKFWFDSHRLSHGLDFFQVQLFVGFELLCVFIISLLSLGPSFCLAWKYYLISEFSQRSVLKLLFSWQGGFY